MSDEILICGFDPGETGGLSFWLCDPVKGTKSFVGYNENRPEYLRDLANPPAVLIAEKVHSHSHDTPKTAFSLGKSFGIMVGCAIGLGIEVRLVDPSDWQGALQRRAMIPKPSGADAYKSRKRWVEECLVKGIGLRVPLRYADAVAIGWSYCEHLIERARVTE